MTHLLPPPASTILTANDIARKAWPGATVYISNRPEGFGVTLDLFGAPSYGRFPSMFHSGTYLTREMAEAQSFAFVLSTVQAMLKDAEERAKKALEEAEHLRGV